MSIVETPFDQHFQPVESNTASVHGERSNVDSQTTINECPTAEPIGDEIKVNDKEEESNIEEEQEYLRKLPPEIGTLLIMVGIAGLLLPGVIGTPLVIAGAVVIWPKTFEPLERRFAKNCPKSHRMGIRQVKRFIEDLNRRFPESKE